VRRPLSRWRAQYGDRLERSQKRRNPCLACVGAGQVSGKIVSEFWSREELSDFARHAIAKSLVIANRQMLRFALPLRWAHDAYVVANRVLLSMRTADNPPSSAFVLATFAVGLGVPIGSAIILTKRTLLT
jgi:hypothetical protein